MGNNKHTLFSQLSNASYFFLKIRTVSEFLTDEGREFHKLGPCTEFSNIKSPIWYIYVIYISKIMIMYVSISLKIVPEYIRNVAI